MGYVCAEDEDVKEPVKAQGQVELPILAKCPQNEDKVKVNTWRVILINVINIVKPSSGYTRESFSN